MMDISRIKFVKGGKVFSLPPGFKFHPSDEELVFEYLKDKIFSGQAVPMIPDIDSCSVDPWHLLDDGGQERYYFVEKKDKNTDGNGTSNGYWKQIGEEKEIKNSDKNFPIIGIKKNFAFYLGKSPRGSLTDWTMQEFQILDLGTGTRTRRFSCIKKNSDKWRVVRVFLNRKNKNEDDRDDDSDTDAGCSSSSGSESLSEVTNVSYSDSDLEETDIN